MEISESISDEKAIKGGGLKTNSQNWDFKEGILVVRGYSSISGNYHNTYYIKTEEPITEFKIKECLDRGVKDPEHLRDCETGKWLISRSC